jgi:hypothetical protein
MGVPMTEDLKNVLIVLGTVYPGQKQNDVLERGVSPHLSQVKDLLPTSPRHMAYFSNANPSLG